MDTSLRIGPRVATDRTILVEGVACASIAGVACVEEVVDLQADAPATHEVYGELIAVSVAYPPIT